VLQLAINILVTASNMLLLAVSFMLIYRAVKFFHFAHGIIFAWGAFFAYMFYKMLNLPIALAIPLAILAAGLSGVLIEIIIYQPMRKKGSTGLVLLLASLGLYTVLQNVISMSFHDSTKSIHSGQISNVQFAGVYITTAQIIALISSVVLVAFVGLFLQKNKFGITLRAVSNSTYLAKISGISVSKTYIVAFAIGSTLASIAGILVAYDVDMTPTMGMSPLMMAVVVMIIGGTNRISGIIIASALLSVLLHIGTWYIGMQWQEAIVFGGLVVFLLFRPKQLLAK
jgi:branched-chain amino acid transport system permease protein